MAHLENLKAFFGEEFFNIKSEKESSRLESEESSRLESEESSRLESEGSSWIESEDDADMYTVNACSLSIKGDVITLSSPGGLTMNSKFLVLLPRFAMKHGFEKLILAEDTAYVAYEEAMILSGHTYEYNLTTLFLLSTGTSYYDHFSFHPPVPYYTDSISEEILNVNVRQFFRNEVRIMALGDRKIDFKMQLGQLDESNTVFKDIFAVQGEMKDLYDQWLLENRRRRMSDQNKQMFKDDYFYKKCEDQADIYLSADHAKFMTVKQYFSRVFFILFHKPNEPYRNRDELRFFILFLYIVHFTNPLSNRFYNSPDTINKKLVWKKPTKRAPSVEKSEERRQRKTLDVWRIVCLNPECVNHLKKTLFNERNECVQCGSLRTFFPVKLFPDEGLLEEEMGEGLVEEAAEALPPRAGLVEEAAEALPPPPPGIGEAPPSDSAGLVEEASGRASSKRKLKTISNGGSWNRNKNKTSRAAKNVKKKSRRQRAK